MNCPHAPVKDPAASAREVFYNKIDALGIKLDARGERKLAEIFQKTVVWAIYRHCAEWPGSNNHHERIVVRCIEEMVAKAKQEAGSDHVPAEVLNAAAEDVIAYWKDKLCPETADTVLQQEDNTENARGVFCELYSTRMQANDNDGDRAPRGM
jgi:hypothetical protein